MRAELATPGKTRIAYRNDVYLPQLGVGRVVPSKKTEPVLPELSLAVDLSCQGNQAARSGQKVTTDAKNVTRLTLTCSKIN